VARLEPKGRTSNLVGHGVVVHLTALSHGVPGRTPD
jgi:hypothetical protein